MPEKKWKILFLGGAVALTLAIHYGWLTTLLFGSSHWVHAIHGRLCYIPIVIAASWFGLRGGLVVATSISLLVMPYIYRTATDSSHDLSGELVEIFFYFAIAVLAGSLVDRELTIRRKHEEAQLQLERSQKMSMVGRMAAGVAHEIKNPLASIKGAVEILSDERTSASDKEEFSGIVSREIKRIDRTVREFLEFARPRETRLERLNLSEALRASLKQMEGQAARQGISMRQDIDSDLFIEGDREKMHQVTLNLLLNAVEACPHGGVIDVRLKSASRGAVDLVVSDTGMGIAAADLEHVFEPFFTTKSSGTGLGLAVVKSIVDSHRGEITLTSTPGQGTTVRIMFPGGKE